MKDLALTVISSFGQHLIVLVGFVGSHTWKIGKLPLPLNTYVEARGVEGAWNCYLNWVFPYLALNSAFPLQMA